mgnify:CR=1 FL=1
MQAETRYQQDAELRVSTEGGTPRLSGYAAVFNRRSLPMQFGPERFVELITPGAFTRSLEDGADVVARVHHSDSHIIGRRSAGTLRVEERSRGLWYQVDLPDTAAARDLAVSVERGDIRGSSFAFNVPEGGDEWTTKGQTTTRTLSDIDLHEVSPVVTPAYPATDGTLALRSLAAWRQKSLVIPRLRLELAAKAVL